DVAKLGERFDLVLFMGVLYHLRHPLLALDLLHEHVVGDWMIFQSLMRGSPETADFQKDYPFSDETPFTDERFPRMYFIERRYAGDPTNWWFPNRACAEAMLRSSGFSIVARPEEEVLIARRAAPDAEKDDGARP
ncbi:MAG: TIGR04290 family methyltransferase, partial [Polyangia bacterium]